MKTIHLNMAARPWRNYRPAWIVAGVLAALTLILFVNNVRTAYRFFVNTEDTRAEIATLEADAMQERERARVLQERLGRFNQRLIQARVGYINAQIEQRAFSWSDLLDHLETVVPNDVRLLSLNPSFGERGVVKLNLSCISKTQDGMVEMIRAMIADPHFESPLPAYESILETGQHQFTLSVVYHPGVREVLE